MGAGGLDTVHDLERIYAVEMANMSFVVLNLSPVLIMNPSHSSGNY